MQEPYVIGVLGGMGTYATIDLFERYAEKFPAAKEWDRPRIIIDNYCTMPSRVRAHLYQERREELVEDMTNAIGGLLRAGCSRVVLACNTSHLFLPEIIKRLPAAEKSILNIIDLCVKRCRDDGRKKVYLLASEGTIDSRVYNDRFEACGITCLTPSEKEYSDLRACIEAVKSQKYDEAVDELFCRLLSHAEELHADAVILGCTELPILYKRGRNQIKLSVPMYDPVDLALDALHEEYLNSAVGQNRSYKKILTFGVFDYFHLGHLRLFEQCKEHADYLIVAVQDEKYIRKYKPDANVLYTTKERVELISALQTVDEVVVYQALDSTILEKIDFDILALGEDHRGDRFDAAEKWCEAHGKRVVRLKRTPGICSSEIKRELAAK